MSVPVVIYSGIGFWRVTTRVNLVACPHTGDELDVNGVGVHCDVVIIGDREVQVREKRPFGSEEDCDAHARETGWERC